MRIDNGLTIFFADSLWINYLFREFTINFLYFSRFCYEIIIYFANLPKIHYLYANLLSISRKNFGFTICFELIMNKLYVSWIHYLFHVYFMTLLSILRFTMNLQPLINDRYTIDSANSKPIYLLFCESLWIYHLVSEVTKNSQLFSRIHQEFTIFFGN